MVGTLFNDENVSFVICRSLDNFTATMINTILPLTHSTPVLHPVANSLHLYSVTLGAFNELTIGRDKLRTVSLMSGAFIDSYSHDDMKHLHNLGHLLR